MMYANEKKARELLAKAYRQTDYPPMVHESHNLVHGRPERRERAALDAIIAALEQSSPPADLSPTDFEKEVAIAQAVGFAEYVERAAKGSMQGAAKHFLSLPYAQQVAAVLTGAGRYADPPRVKTITVLHGKSVQLERMPGIDEYRVVWQDRQGVGHA